MSKLSSGIKYLIGDKSTLIVLNTLNNVLPQFSTLLISILVVRFVSLEVWGEYAAILIMFTFITQFLSWGNKEYLLREFSFHPSQIKKTWTTSLIARSLFLIPVLPIFFFLSIPFQTIFCISIIVILRFIHQSHDSLIFYYRNYTLKIILETVYCALFTFAIIYFKKQLELHSLILITLSLEVLKTISMVAVSKTFLLEKSDIGLLDYFKKSFPFFLLTFTSMVVSRIDQVGASIFLEASETGKYQIIMGFLLIIQASSNYVLQPFLKNVYRSKFSTIQKVSLNLFLLGTVICAAGIAGLYFILLFVYRIQVDSFLLLESYLFVLPIFLYSPYIFSLLKNGKTGIVILLNIKGCLLIGLFSVCLMNWYGKNIHMLLGASALTQFILLFAYVVAAHVGQASYEEKS